MREKDKQIIEDSVDAVVSTVPGLNIAWGLSKALYGAGLKLRQQKALEWVEMIRDKPLVFTKEVLKDEKFQDAFAYALEKYLAERNENKRRHLRNVFMSFAKNNKKSEFELEKFIHILSQLNENDIQVLKYVNTRTPSSYQVFDDRVALENVYNLINVGVLFIDPSSKWGSLEAPFVYTSNFGRRFIRYLKNEKAI